MNGDARPALQAFYDQKLAELRRYEERAPLVCGAAFMLGVLLGWWAQW